MKQPNTQQAATRQLVLDLGPSSFCIKTFNQIRLNPEEHINQIENIHYKAIDALAEAGVEKPEVKIFLNNRRGRFEIYGFGKLKNGRRIYPLAVGLTPEKAFERFSSTLNDL